MEVFGSQEYMEALEEELNKIMLFQKELPLSLQVVAHAIDACRRRIETERIGVRSESTATEMIAIDAYSRHIATQRMGVPSESEETSWEGGPLLEEFLPIRRDSYDTPKQDHRADDRSDENYGRPKKPDWLRSVQLWNQEAETSTKEIVDSNRKAWSTQKNKSSQTKKRANFTSSCNEKRSAPFPTASVSDAAASQSARSTNEGDDKEVQLQKKARRCWSPELHDRFLHALRQLGGSEAATPKHIRELMKVDGLTCDEIKSHLQKYRLHSRRAGSPSSETGDSRAAQFVVVSGIWVAPELTAAASCGQAPDAAVATIYTPMAITATTTTSRAPATPSPARTPKAKI